MDGEEEDLDGEEQDLEGEEEHLDGEEDDLDGEEEDLGGEEQDMDIEDDHLPALPEEPAVLPHEAAEGVDEQVNLKMVGFLCKQNNIFLLIQTVSKARAPPAEILVLWDNSWAFGDRDLLAWDW